MTKRKTPENLEPQAPELFRHIKWIQLHWRRHWKVLAIAVVIVSAYPAYQIAQSAYSSYLAIFGGPARIGAFKLTIVNRSLDSLHLSNVGEFYLHAPETPGMNRQVSSGVIQLEVPGGQFVLKVAPLQAITVWATLLNEERLLPYLDAGEYFGLIIFSADPKPIRTEVLFTRDTFKKGVLLVVETNKPSKSSQPIHSEASPASTASGSQH